MRCKETFLWPALSSCLQAEVVVLAAVFGFKLVSLDNSLFPIYSSGDAECKGTVLGEVINQHQTWRPSAI